MLTNFHTHTNYCDGKDSPEDIVIAALEKGFVTIGFSGHGYTPYDLRYCMQDTEGYIKEIRRLQEKYRNDIEIYLGVEEDAFAPVDRARFDYVIGSLHYVYANDKFLPVDSSLDYFVNCLNAFDNDIISFATAYYESFCRYISARKPDIVGHFDLITKFDEQNSSLLIGDEKYNELAEKYIYEAAKTGCVFEVNTGAMARGLRTTPFPASNLLYILKKLDANIILSSDSHCIDTLDYGFEDIKKHLRDIGFTKLMTIKKGSFSQYSI